jgi:BirA family biotin operon repressor/biotin-[acetyl-CoA-carboxylase] ligase
VTASSRLPDRFRLRTLGSVASTNDEARRLAEEGAPAGLVVVAREQTRGRGRYGRSWVSPPGNLNASVLLRPDCALAATAQLSLVAGLARAEALSGSGPPDHMIALKWPNDVLINGAKTAGILLENAVRPDGRAGWVIVGSGVNIVSCPKDTPYPATCLAAEGFPPIEPLALLEAYLGALDRWLGRWQAAGIAAVRDSWRARSFGLGREIRLRLEREELCGRFVDLTEGGALLLEEAGGRRREIAAGEVFYPGR